MARFRSQAVRSAVGRVGDRVSLGSLNLTLSLAFRSLASRPSRTLLTGAGIVLGVAVILAISITNLSTLESLKQLFEEASGKADLAVNSVDTSGQGFSESTLRVVSAVPAVKAAVPSLHVQTVLASESRTEQIGLSMLGTSFNSLMLYGVDPFVDAEVRDYKIAAGKFLPKDLDVYEVVLVEDYAEDNKISLGDDLAIITPGGIERLRVVGLMSKEGAGKLNNGSFGVLPLGTAQKMFGRSGDLDEIDVVAGPEAAGGPGLEMLKTAIQARLGGEYTVTFPAAQGERRSQMMDSFTMGLSSVSAIALFVGCFLIYNAFSMTVVERTREIGMLRTVGMTRGQVTSQILVEAIVLGFLGSGVGILLGFVLSRGLIRASEVLVGQELRQIQVPLGGLISSVVVGLGATLIAAVLPAWQAGRISPLEALRVRGLRREGWIIRRGWILGIAVLIFSYLMLSRPAFISSVVSDQAGMGAVFGLFIGVTLMVPATVGMWDRITRPLISRIYGNEGGLGSSNIQRAKLRTALTVAALMVGTAMVLTTLGLTATFEYDITDWVRAYIGGDLYILSYSPMRTDLGQRFETVEGVAAATPIRYFDVSWAIPDGGKETLVFTAIDPASHPRVTSISFAANQGDPDALLADLAAGDAVFVSTTISEKYALRPGDVMQLETRRGTRDFRVAAIVVDYYNNGMSIHGSWEDMRRYFRLDDASVFLVKAKEGVETSVIRDRIDRVYGDRNHLTMMSNEVIRDQALSLTSGVFGLFDIVVLICMIVAALGVVNTLTMNVLERRQEIGMLRSLGMTQGQVGKMILAEAIVLGIIGGAFGTISGIVMARMVLLAISASRGYQMTYMMPVAGIFISLIGALIASQLAALWPARRAARLRIIEAIQFE